MKTIEILVGIPCSGKSTYSYKRYSAGMNGVYDISRDSIRESSRFLQPYTFSKRKEELVTDIFNKKILMYFELEDCTTLILDNTHCKEKYIDKIINKYAHENIKIKFFDIPLWKAHYRNIVRYFNTGKWIPIKVMNTMYRNYNKINKKKYEKYYI